MTPLYIFDIDGTLANQKHRQHHLDNKDYDTYYSLVREDRPIMPVCHLYWALKHSRLNPTIWFFSGRRDSCKEDTVWWLRRYLDKYISPVHVTMRLTGDYRDDVVVKQEMIDHMLVDDRERLVCAFDDRQRVVDMWRRNGITCMQVAPGDF